MLWHTGAAITFLNVSARALAFVIDDLETNADPAGMVRQNIILKAERDRLVAKLAELKGDAAL